MNVGRTFAMGMMMAGIALTGSFLTGCQPKPAAEGEAPAVAQAETGETLFSNNCAGCHAGGGNAMVPSKPVKGSPKLASVETFTQFLRNPSGGMPAYDEGSLSDAQVAELHKYLQATYK